MADKKNVPEIRFKGFEGEWEKSELGQIVKITMGQSPLGVNYTNNPDDHILVQGNADMKNGNVIPRVWTKQVTKTADANDLIMSVRAPVGEIGKTAFNIVIGRGVAAIKGNEFIFQSLKRMNENGFWKQFSAGSTFDSINSTDLFNSILSITTEPEQTQIGTYFQNLDSLISLHQRKYNKLLTVKKAMLEKMFPREGADVPEIRFKGFEGKWEKKKLGEIGSVVMNRRIFKDQTAEKGEIPFYKIGTFGSKPDAFISRELFEEYKNKYPYPKYGDILISASGSIGRTVEYLGVDEYFQDSNIVWLDHDQSITNTFLKYFYTVVKWEGLEGSTIKRLYNKNILETKIYLPSIEEQTKIGNFFQNLDTLITQHQKELEKLKNLKKACLEKMFV